MTKLASSIIENKETVTHYEKLVKTGLILMFLVYLAVSNGVLEDDKAKVLPSVEILSALGNKSVWLDFWNREGFILVLVMCLFLTARSYNNFLDEEEAKFMKQ